MAKQKAKTLRERLILLLGGTLKRRQKTPAPENKARGRAPENKSSLEG